MNILLVGINARFTHSNLGILYLRNEIVSEGHNAEIAEFSINDNVLTVLEHISRKKPDAVMISVYIWNSEYVGRFISDIKKILPSVKIILGGPEAGYNSGKWLLNFPCIDLIIHGAGEDAVLLLAQNSFDADKILPGGGVDKEGKLLSVRNRSFKNINSPYIDGDFELLKNRYLYYESSRGCPFGCSYCLSSREDQALEFKSAAQTIEELSYILKFDPMIIKFVDRSFNVKSDRAREIWKFCSEHKGVTGFHFEIHPLYLSEEDLKIIENIEPGKFQFEIGIQSIHTETLKSIHREAAWDRIKENIVRIIQKRNIHTHLDMIAGLPFERFDDIADSFNQIISLRPDHFQLGFLKVLPGTEMSYKAGDFGMLQTETPPYQVLANKWVSAEEMNLLRSIEHTVGAFYNGGLHDELLASCGGVSAFDCYRIAAEYFISHQINPHTRQKQKLEAIIASLKSN